MSLNNYPPHNMEEIQHTGENTALLKKTNSRSGINADTCERKTTNTWPIILIILTLMLERAAYYGILSNLILFISDDLHESQDVTVVCVFVFTSLAWMMSTIGGVLGDSYTGRFKAILGSLIIYIVGAVLLEIIAYCSKENSPICTKKLSASQGAAFILCTLFIISIGEGAFKANITAFGAEQLKRQDEKTYRAYFNWFYFGINFGCFCGYSVLAVVQQYYGFFIGYYPPLGCVLLACILFIIPKSNYIIYPLSENVFKKVYHIMKEAKARKKSNATRGGCPGLEDVMPIRSWLDRAMIKYGGSYLDSEVEEVKTLGRIGIMFIILVPYWMIYYQMNSTFLLQGIHMNLNVKWKNASINKSCGENAENKAIIPAASLSLADVVVVLLVIPLMEKIVYPWLDRKGWEMTLSKRILIGFFLAIASMVAAGVVEHFRHDLVERNEIVTQCINFHTKYAANLTIFYQIPQYALIGISEAFASVGSLEFAYQESPQSMHGFVMGLFYLVQSVASLLGAALYAFSSNVLTWTARDKKKSQADLGEHMDYYFYLLGVIMFLTWLIFVVLSVKFDLKHNKRKQSTRTKRQVSNKHMGSLSQPSSSYSSVVT